MSLPVKFWMSFLLIVFLPGRPLLAAEGAEETTGQKKDSMVTSLHLQGLSTTSKSLVKKELLHHTGAPFSEEAWQKEKNSLESLDIFSRIELEREENEEGVSLTYRFSELPPMIPFISMKITDQNGFIAGPALAFLNMFGEAMRFELYARATMYPDFFQARELLATIASRWCGPLPLEYDIWFLFNDLYNPLKNFKERSLTTEGDFFYRLTREFKVLFTTGLFTVWHDRAHTEFISGDYRAPLFLSGGEEDLVPRIGIGAVYDARDRRLDPRSGFFGEVRATQFAGFLGGDGGYTEILMDLRAYFSPAKRHVLHLSALGQYRPGTMGAYHFFHAGGPNTLRGYEPDSDLVGQHEFLGTFEYRYEAVERTPFTLWGFNLYAGLQIVAGIDVAVLWKSKDSFSHPSTLAGYFAGLHLLFPGFDRLRLEGGIHRGEVNEKRVAFAFSIGLWEKAVVQRWRIR